MLELGNYQVDPLVANALSVIAVFEAPALRLYSVEPHELPDNWHIYPRGPQTQRLGDTYLLNDHYDGILVPSCTINTELAASPLNEVRQSIYANVVLNAERDAVKCIKLKSMHSPIYSDRLFNS